MGLKLSSTDDGIGGTKLAGQARSFFCLTVNFLGATVNAVVPGGAAEPAGLMPGDLLASINGVDVRDRVHSDVRASLMLGSWNP